MAMFLKEHHQQGQNVFVVVNEQKMWHRIHFLLLAHAFFGLMSRFPRFVSSLTQLAVSSSDVISAKGMNSVSNCRRQRWLQILTGRLASVPVKMYLLLMNTPSDTSVPLETVITELSLAIGQLLRRLRAETNPDGLTWSQTVALSGLEKDGPMTTADLARVAAVKPQSMGATLAELEREGLVKRSPHPTDGRQVLFALTAEGVKARRKRSVAKQKWLLAAMAKLDPDERQTLVFAAALIKRLSEDGSIRPED
jgi:DNA-binding MarR family transcriptional regulator